MYDRYYEIMLEMINTKAFSGVAHPDSIKCFGFYPGYSLESTYEAVAKALNKAGMYAEQSGGLALNYGFPEMGMNPEMLSIFKKNAVRILTASDAHRPEHAGINIVELQNRLK
jgi:histidinol-phosphatase (PHP family)